MVIVSQSLGLITSDFLVSHNLFEIQPSIQIPANSLDLLRSGLQYP